MKTINLKTTILILLVFISHLVSSSKRIKLKSRGGIEALSKDLKEFQEDDKNSLFFLIGVISAWYPDEAYLILTFLSKKENERNTIKVARALSACKNKELKLKFITEEAKALRALYFICWMGEFFRARKAKTVHKNSKHFQSELQHY